MLRVSTAVVKNTISALAMLIWFTARGVDLTADDPYRVAAPQTLLLTQRCLSCHSGDEAKGKLDLTTPRRSGFRR